MMSKLITGGFAPRGLGGGAERPDRQRERALKSAAWALLALEKLDVVTS